MDDIDSLLTRVRNVPLDPRLATIDDAVLAGLARQSQSPLSATTVAFVAVLSLSVGLLGSMAPAAPAQAATVFPLGAPAALAPSTLLGGH
jgi:hypothetical protein